VVGSCQKNAKPTNNKTNQNMEGKRKRGLCKRLGDKVEEYLNIMRIKNKQLMARDASGMEEHLLGVKIRYRL
jgi:hypothetical protein